MTSPTRGATVAERWNIRTVGWSDLGGSGDAMHVQPWVSGGLHILELDSTASRRREQA